MKELGDAHLAMLSSLSNADERSFGVFKMLQEVYPALADKLFEGNAIMKRLILSGHNPMDILDYPLCGKCETLAPYNGYGKKNNKRVPRCTCMKEKCSHSTLDPVTLRDWLKYEMKKKVKPDFFTIIEIAVDEIAATLMLKHIREMKRILEKKSAEDSKKLGIYMPDGSVHEMQDKDMDSVSHLRNAKPDMPDNAVILDDSDF